METSVYHIYFDSELDCVVMKWDGYSTSAEFRKGTELMLSLLIKHKTSRVLADIKDMVLIGLEDQQWMENDFLPRAINSGFGAIGIIQPDHYFNKIAVETISYKVDKEKLQIRFFDNLNEAKIWLRTLAIDGEKFRSSDN